MARKFNYSEDETFLKKSLSFWICLFFYSHRYVSGSSSSTSTIIYSLSVILSSSAEKREREKLNNFFLLPSESIYIFGEHSTCWEISDNDTHINTVLWLLSIHFKFNSKLWNDGWKFSNLLFCKKNKNK